MDIYPAIDLLDGKAVRLYRGDYEKKTVYGENPLEIALYFKSRGAKYLHTVDLNGAKSGKPEQFPLIEKIIAGCGLSVEVGGGIRDAETVDRYIGAGAFRVVLGTAAVADKNFLRKCVNKYGGKIAVGADFKDGMVAVKGWTEVSSRTVESFLAEMNALGVKTVICTDINKDGALSGVNTSLYAKLSGVYEGELIASGGVTRLGDIVRLAGLRVSGVILGRALYTNAVDLGEALKAAKGES